MKDLGADFITSYFKLNKYIRLIINGIIGFAISYSLRLFFLQNESDTTGYWFILVLGSVLWLLIQLFLHLAHEYCTNYRPEKEFLKDMKEIEETIKNTSIYKIFKSFIIQFVEDITEKQIQGFDQQKTPNVDLTFELASFKNEDMSEDGEQLSIKTKAIMGIRRKRILQICSSLLDKKVKLFYATEFHLIDVISDEDKWNNDQTYRDALQDDINIKDCSEKKRIIGIKKSDYDNIKNNSHFEDFISYLEWHVNNKWEAHLYIIRDDLYPLKLKTLGLNNDDCNDLTDFLYVEYCNKKGTDKECVVFAQNDEGKCKYFKLPTNSPSNPVSDYKSLFMKLLNKKKDNDFKRQERHVIDEDFISNLKNN